MIVVDAGVWVSVAIPTDPFRTVSRAWLAATVRAGEAVAGPCIVLAEVAGAVARRSGDVRKADEAVQRLIATPRLTLLAIDDALALDAARLAADLGLRGADAAYVAAADRLACPLITWDAETIHKTRGKIAARQPSA